jgi:hypothetical protein
MLQHHRQKKKVVPTVNEALRLLKKNWLTQKWWKLHQ